MRRTWIGLLLVAGMLALAGCGNKGPLVRPPAHHAATHAPAAPSPTPAPGVPTSVPLPAVAASTGSIP